MKKTEIKYPVMKDFYPFKIVYPQKKEIGIEIEVEGKNVTRINKNKTWKVTNDGSLRGEETAEYILYHPVSIKEVKSKIIKLTNLMELAGATKDLSDRCGVHIHISVQHSTFEEVMKHICLYLILEHVLVSYCGDSREGNLFCLRASDAENLITELIKSRKNSEFSKITNKENEYRYASINCESISKHGSLEFRAMKTPEDFQDIVTWTDILYKIKTASLTFESLEELVEAFSMLEYENFLGRIFGNLSRELIDNVNDINKKLIKGVRLVQDIAYTKVEIPPVRLEDIKKKEMGIEEEGRINFNAQFEEFINQRAQERPRQIRQPRMPEQRVQWQLVNEMPMVRAPEEQPPIVPNPDLPRGWIEEPREGIRVGRVLNRARLLGNEGEEP